MNVWKKWCNQIFRLLKHKMADDEHDNSEYLRSYISQTQADHNLLTVVVLIIRWHHTSRENTFIYNSGHCVLSVYWFILWKTCFCVLNFFDKYKFFEYEILFLSGFNISSHIADKICYQVVIENYISPYDNVVHSRTQYKWTYVPRFTRNINCSFVLCSLMYNIVMR